MGVNIQVTFPVSKIFCLNTLIVNQVVQAEGKIRNDLSKVNQSYSLSID